MHLGKLSNGRSAAAKKSTRPPEERVSTFCRRTSPATCLVLSSQSGKTNLCCHGRMQPFNQLDRAKSCDLTPWKGFVYQGFLLFPLITKVSVQNLSRSLHAHNYHPIEVLLALGLLSNRGDCWAIWPLNASQQLSWSIVGLTWVVLPERF